MSGATFVVCPGCGRLMLGQVDRLGLVYPQPHGCVAPNSEPKS